MKYAAIVKDSIFVPGDERSRTNPGHGYPDRYEETISFREFADEDEMKAWVLSNTGARYTPPKFKLIKYEELSYSTSVSIDIKEKP